MEARDERAPVAVSDVCEPVADLRERARADRAGIESHDGADVERDEPHAVGGEARELSVLAEPHDVRASCERERRGRRESHALLLRHANRVAEARDVVGDGRAGCGIAQALEDAIVERGEKPAAERHDVVRRGEPRSPTERAGVVGKRDDDARDLVEAKPAEQVHRDRFPRRMSVPRARARAEPRQERTRDGVVVRLAGAQRGERFVVLWRTRRKRHAERVLLVAAQGRAERGRCGGGPGLVRAVERAALGDRPLERRERPRHAACSEQPQERRSVAERRVRAPSLDAHRARVVEADRVDARLLVAQLDREIAVAHAVKRRGALDDP